MLTRFLGVGDAAAVEKAQANIADANVARLNAPAVVFGQIGMELLITLGIATAINAALVFFHAV